MRIGKFTFINKSVKIVESFCIKKVEIRITPKASLSEQVLMSAN